MKNPTSRAWTFAGIAALLGAGPVFGQGYLSAVDSNKKVVFDFYRLVVEPRNADLIEIYVSPDFVDHDPSEQKGAESVAKMLKSMSPAASDDISPALRNPPVYVMAQADLVTWVFKQSALDPKDKSKSVERMVIEAYRVKDRKIVEHWKGVAGAP